MMNKQETIMLVAGLVVVVVLCVLVYRHMNNNTARNGESEPPVDKQEPDEDEDEEDVVENFYSVGGAEVPGVDETPENAYLLDDGNNREDMILDNLCSKSCCSPQYPTPFTLKDDAEVCKNKDKYVKSNIFCNNPYQDSGCLCLTKNQAITLTTRGGNASSI